MDPRRLDALARTLAAAPTRRTVLRLLLVAVAVRLGGDTARAACVAGRTLGEACTPRCTCTGDLRCGAPRPKNQRPACRQRRNAGHVCCRGLGETCGDDCNCCGRRACIGRRCRPCPTKRRCPGTCCPAGEVCAPGGGVCCPPESVCTVGGVPEACCVGIGTCVGGVCVIN